MKYKKEDESKKPLSIAQRLLQKKKNTYEFYNMRKELKTAAGRRLHKLGEEIIKEDIK